MVSVWLLLHHLNPPATGTGHIYSCILASQDGAWDTGETPSASDGWMIGWSAPLEPADLLMALRLTWRRVIRGRDSPCRWSEVDTLTWLNLPNRCTPPSHGSVGTESCVLGTLHRGAGAAWGRQWKTEGEFLLWIQVFSLMRKTRLGAPWGLAGKSTKVQTLSRFKGNGKTPTQNLLPFPFLIPTSPSFHW